MRRPSLRTVATTILLSLLVTVVSLPLSPAFAATLWPSSTVPATVDSGPDSAVELGLRFSSDTAGVVTGARFYKAAANSGIHAANLWSATGTRLATATFSGETAAGWQQVSFSAPVAITAGTTYVISYHAGSGHYSCDQNYFATSGVDSPPLHAPASGVSALNGVYAYGSSSIFPSQGWRSSNYWVDVVFSTDTTPPAVTSFSVPATSDSLAVAVSSFTASDNTAVTGYLITESSGPPAAGATGWSGTAPATYSFASGGHKLLYAWAKDASGNVSSPLTAEVDVTATATGPTSLWPASAVPGVADGGPDSSVELGVKFRADSAGTVNGIRFYKAAANSGTHTASLWNASGTRLATATFSAETASGWQQVSFGTPVAITAGTVYVASYHAAGGHYSCDQNYFATGGVDNPPLHALAAGVSGVNGVYAYGSTSSFPSQGWNSSNYWVDVLFTPADSSSDTTPPTVTSFAVPATATSLTVPVTSFVASDNTAVTGYLITESAAVPSTGATGWSITPPASYTFDTAGSKTLYAWARDAAGNVSTALTAISVITLPASRPILLITSSGNPFTGYYAEILRTEGLNEFSTKDISSLSPALLASCDLVILGETALTAAQAATLTAWVNEGGRLIAMRPDKKLASLFGLSDLGATLPDAYLSVSGSSAAGKGIVRQTIQYHGTADLYGTGEAIPLATLYSSATTATSHPAVTLRPVGVLGGQAAAFTYDLARSVVLTRQGNPAWAGMERDGYPPVRSDDLFYGNAGADPHPDWVDPSKLAIPQADEQQRLLANLVMVMNQHTMPLPRFWYFPRSLPAVVVMTGDDHGNGGTIGRFDSYKAMGPSGCSVEGWECIRGTSYIFSSTPLSNGQAVSYDSDGFEVALHVNSNCVDWTPASLESSYTAQYAAWQAKYSGLPAPDTHRLHCVVWSDYATQPRVELSHGMRLDTTYYFWPPGWVANTPGFFTGSGIPMRFADASGNLIDVYQAPTQMTDESGQSYPFTIDTLLDRAIGPEGYYGAFVANMHNDTAYSAGSSAIVASARARGIPVISARQLLTWLDSRAAAQFEALDWSGTTLSFLITGAKNARGLTAMVPVPDGRSVTRVALNGTSLPFTVTVIKGISHAVFAASSGSFQVSFSAAAAPQAAISIPAAGATVSGSTSVEASAASDSGVTRVEFYLDGVLQATTTSPYHWTWDTTLTANGSHTLTARVYDSAGGTAASAPVPVIVANATAPVALLQNKAGIISSGQSLSVSFASPVTAGSLLVVTVSGYTGKSSSLTVTDSLGNSYQAAGSVMTVQGVQSAIYYTVTATAGVNAVSVRMSASGQLSVAVAEFSGIDSASPLAASAGTSGNSATPSSDSLSPIATGDLVIGSGTHNCSTVTTAGAGFSMIAIPTEDSVSHQPLALEYRVAGTAQGIPADFALESSCSWLQNGAVFRHR